MNLNNAQALISPQYRKAMQVALGLQIPISIICLLVLDFGRLARICGIAMLGFWLVAALIAIRRPWAPTSTDLWFWRWGFILCFVFTIVLAAWA